MIKHRKQQTENSPPTHPSPSRGEGKGGGESLYAGFRSLNSEKGIALVTVLVLSLISLAIIATLVYLVIQGTRFSGFYKRYATALEAGIGGTEIASALIKNRGNLVIPNPGNLANPWIINSTVTCDCGDPTTVGDTTATPSTAANLCLCRKLCDPPYSSDPLTYNWGVGGICSTDDSDGDGVPDTVSTKNPRVRYDMQFTLSGMGGINYEVSAKIVDTTLGNSDLSGEELGGTAVVSSSGSTISPPPLPYMYRVEINSQSTSTSERSRLSVLYAF